MKKLFTIAVLGTFMFSCGSSTKVSRLDTKTEVDLSGRWNDVDAQMVSKEMIKQMFNSRGWINKFREKHNDKTPVLIVGKIKNKTSEHINTSVFSKEIEKECINSGLADFVASSSEREEIRQERLEQEGNASMETTKQMGNETGADFMLKGEISSIEDAIDGKKIIYYQVNLELINIETNRKSWIGDKKIKKFIGRNKYKM